MEGDTLGVKSPITTSDEDADADALAITKGEADLLPLRLAPDGLGVRVFEGVLERDLLLLPVLDNDAGV